MLVIDGLKSANGNTLQSDVADMSTSPCSPSNRCVFSDSADVTLRIVMKDVTITTPTPMNDVTINRYHVEYARADGRNKPGLDVPYPFDGAITGTIEPTPRTMNFELVRHVAKEESPLVELLTNRQIISSIARVTFYGHDAAGNEVSVTGSILIDFGDFQDK